MAFYNCAYEAFQAGWGSDVLSGQQKKIEDLISDIGSITLKVVDQCKDELALAVLGKAFKLSSDEERASMALLTVRAMFDFKPQLAVQEAAWATWASRIGLDYFHARLTITHARDPGIDLFAGL